MAELNAEVRLVDIGAHHGLAGKSIVNYAWHAVDGGSELTLLDFDDGRALVFRCIMDRTAVEGYRDATGHYPALLKQE